MRMQTIYVPPPYRTCDRCGYSLSQATKAARRNARRLAMPDNPHPLQFNAFCARARRWIDTPSQGCDGFLDPAVLDVNHQPLPLPSVYRSFAVLAGMYITSIVATAIIVW